jgi:tRNA A37 methylthiotransferase MiaB
MGRRYTAEDFLGIVDAFREKFQDLSIITDVIVGFPGETEEDFRQTLELIRSLQPDKVNVTRFSRRPGTRASKLYDMPDRIKKDRSRELTRLWLEIAAPGIAVAGQVLMP